MLGSLQSFFSLAFPDLAFEHPEELVSLASSESYSTVVFVVIVVFVVHFINVDVPPI